MRSLRGTSPAICAAVLPLITSPSPGASGYVAPLKTRQTNPEQSKPISVFSFSPPQT